MEFLDLLEEHGIPVAPEGHRHSTAGWIQIDCPFCGPASRKYHMGYNITGKYANCWSCGYHHLSATMEALFGIPAKRARILVQQISGTVTPEPKPRGRFKTPSNLKHLGYAHIKYLRSRGFNPTKLIKLWNLRAMVDRIWIPIYYRGEPVSWTSRVINKTSGARYLSATASEESVSHRDILYGLDYVRNAAIIVEGPTDVWKIGPSAIATFGIDFNTKQLELISKIPVRAVWFDNEPTAQKMAQQLVNALGVLPGDTFRIIPSDDMKDPGSTPHETIRKIKEEILR